MMVAVIKSLILLLGNNKTQDIALRQKETVSYAYIINRTGAMHV
jgi:hypothetical protein